MQLGPFEVDHPFILAPMAGITNSPFRRLMRRMNSAVVISELISANGMKYGSDKTLDMLKFAEEERTLGLQIFGEDDDALVLGCENVAKQGADFIDLNLGCPVNKIVKKGAGSAMCRNPAQLGRTLTKMVKSVDIPVTIKIRTGWTEDTRNADEVVKAATDAGVAWVAIHGRSRAKGYSGLADWDYIAEVKQKSSIPIIGNGDVLTAEGAVAKYKQYGLDGIMIGRAALRNPFIFNQAKALLAGKAVIPTSADMLLELLNQQKQLLAESFDERGSMLHSRKFLSWYSAGYPGSSAFRKLVFTTDDRDELWGEAAKFFEHSVRNRDMEFLSEPFLMGGHG